MILRGPGHPSRQAEYPAEDERVAAEIGRVGERMLPFYRSLVIHRDLYDVHGGFVGWTYEHLGIFSFTNELWNNDQLLGRPSPSAAGADPGPGRRRDRPGRPALRQRPAALRGHVRALEAGPSTRSTATSRSAASSSSRSGSRRRS